MPLLTAQGLPNGGLGWPACGMCRGGREVLRERNRKSVEWSGQISKRGGRRLWRRQWWMRPAQGSSDEGAARASGRGDERGRVGAPCTRKRLRVGWFGPIWSRRQCSICSALGGHGWIWSRRQCSLCSALLPHWPPPSRAKLLRWPPPAAPPRRRLSPVAAVALRAAPPLQLPSA